MTAETPEKEKDAELPDLDSLDLSKEEKPKLSKEKLIRAAFDISAFLLILLILNSGYMLSELSAQIVFNVIMLVLAGVFFNLWRIIKLIKAKRNGTELKDLPRDEPFKSVFGIPILFIVMAALIMFVSLLLVLII